jgi:hypothetical protein
MVELRQRFVQLGLPLRTLAASSGAKERLVQRFCSPSLTNQPSQTITVSQARLWPGCHRLRGPLLGRSRHASAHSAPTTPRQLCWQWMGGRAGGGCKVLLGCWACCIGSVCVSGQRRWFARSNVLTTGEVLPPGSAPNGCAAFPMLADCALLCKPVLRCNALPTDARDVHQQTETALNKVIFMLF